MEEICLFPSKRSTGLSPDRDGIPNKFYKVAPLFFYAWLSYFINCAFSHSFLPGSLTGILVNSILTSSLKDPVDANNYSPIAIVSEASKIIEKFIFVKLPKKI